MRIAVALSIADDAGADLAQLELQAGQRPVGHRLGQFDAASAYHLPYTVIYQLDRKCLQKW
jgi:hypothetical protein